MLLLVRASFLPILPDKEATGEFHQFFEINQVLCRNSESQIIPGSAHFFVAYLRYSNQYPIEVLKEHGAGTVICVECAPEYSPVCSLLPEIVAGYLLNQKNIIQEITMSDSKVNSFWVI